ncbi:MAG: hypothetical protein HC903_25945 [Methylacidiphilales bacterium]|nr:hypothetical protein [Candidatus Methylacidiphilales bacterium]
MHLQMQFDYNINVKGHQKAVREKSGFESGSIGSKESKAQILIEQLSALGDEELEIGLDFRPVPFIDNQRHTSIFIRRIPKLNDNKAIKKNGFLGVVEAFGSRYGNLKDSLVQYVAPDGNLKTMIIVSNSKSLILPDIRLNYYLSLPGDRPGEHSHIGNTYISLYRGSAHDIKNTWLKIMAAAQHLNNLNMRYGLQNQNSNWGTANLLAASGFGDLIQTKIKHESKWNSLGLYEKVLNEKYLKNDGIFRFRTVKEAKNEVDKLNLKPVN